MSLLSSSDATFFGFEDHTMDITEFFTGSEDLLSEGFGMESHSLMPSPPEIRRSGSQLASASSSTTCPTSLFYHQPLVGDEESGPESEDQQASCSSASSSSSSQGATETSANDQGWTKEDTLRLTDLVKFYGHNWQEIAKSFDGNTHSPEDCQQQYQILIDYVTKQNQLQLLETADESDPSGSPSPACEFLFSSPGDSSIDPFIMQALGENDVVMEMGNLGNYTAVPGLNHHHHHHSHHHLHHHSPHQHVDMASVNSMNAASLLEMNPLSALSGMGITMESYGLRQQPVRRFTMVPSASMSVIHPPTKSRKTSSGSGSKASAKKKADKAKKKALRRAEKEKRKEQRRRKREKKQKLNEKKRAEKEGQQQLGEAAIVKKEPSAGKKRERDESHKPHPTKEFHKQPRLESSSKSGTKESKGTPKKSKKSGINVKPEPIDATEGAPTSAFISAGPAPTSAFLASPAATTPASTPIPSNVSVAAKMAASLGPSMMSLASAVQFQQRTNYGQPMLTQQRMLYPMIMPRLQPPSVLPPPVPGLLPPPASATAAAAAVVAATASMCGVILPNPPSTSRTNSPTPPPSSASSPSSLRAQPSGAATTPITSPRGSNPASALVGASADVAAPAGEQSLAPATTAPVSVGAPSAADGTASEAPAPPEAYPIQELAPSLASPTTDPIASTPASATVPVSPASPSAVGDSANLKRKQPEDAESQEEADKIAAAVAACLAGPAKKRKRRTAAEIERKYKCEMPNCTKSYGSEGALKMHVKLKHPGVKQPALKTPAGVAPRINSQSSLPLLLQFPLPFMPGLMGGSQPIFPAPSPAAIAAANSALVSAMHASVASTPVPRPQAQATSPPTPSPATAMATPTSTPAPAAPGSTSAPPFIATPSASSSSSSSSPLLSSTSSSTSNSMPSSSPSPSVPRVSAASLIPKLSAFLASSPSPSLGSAFSSFSVHGAPMASPFAHSTPAAPSSSLSTPPICSAAATTTTPALALPSAPAAASSSDSVLVVPSLVLPTVLSDLKPPPSSASPHLFEVIARLPTTAEPAAPGPTGGDQQMALLPCKLEIIDEASDRCGGFDSAYSSPRLASDDISSSTSPSSPSGSPSPMSPPVSAADLLVDTLGRESMLSLPPATLMDEESATTAPDSDATAIASDDLHTVLSISEANLGDVRLSAVGDSSINGNCNGQGGASSDSVGAGGSVQPPFDLPSSFFNPLSFAGDELEHVRSPAECEVAPAPGEPQPNQPALQPLLAAAPSFGGGVYDDEDARLQRALDGQEQNRDGEDLLDESPFHTGAFLVNGCSDDLAQLPRLSFSQHTIGSL